MGYDYDLDPLIDPVGYEEALSRTLQAKVEAATAPLRERNARLEHRVRELAAEEAAGRVGDTLEALGFGDLAAHPHFTTLYRQAASHLSPEQLADPDTAVRITLMLAPELRPRGAGGRPTPATKVSDTGTSPRPGATDPKCLPSPTSGRELHRMAAERLGLSPVEADVLLHDHTGIRYQEIRTDRKRRRA